LRDEARDHRRVVDARLAHRGDLGAHRAELRVVRRHALAALQGPIEARVVPAGHRVQQREHPVRQGEAAEVLADAGVDRVAELGVAARPEQAQERLALGWIQPGIRVPFVRRGDAADLQPEQVAGVGGGAGERLVVGRLAFAVVALLVPRLREERARDGIPARHGAQRI